MRPAEEGASVTELDEAGWDLTLNVGLKAVFLASKYAIPVMRRTGGGAIINTGSVHSLVSFATCTAYDSAKAGILGLTRVLALDYGPEIRVNAVLPGAILTPLWDNLEVPEEERRRYALPHRVRTQRRSHPSTPRQAIRTPTTISTAPIDASRVRRPARPVCRAPMLTPATADRPMSTARG